MLPFDLIQTPIETGRTLIEASAGTGKTYTLTAIVARLMIEHALGLDEILVCTFTEAATAELRERVREMLHEAVDLMQGRPGKKFGFLTEIIRRRSAGALPNLQTALRNIDQASIFTIHGFCQRLLQDRAFESGNSLETSILSDESDIRRETVEDFWRRKAYSTEPLVTRLLLTRHPTPNSLIKFVNSIFRYPEIEFIRRGGLMKLDEAFEIWRLQFEKARTHWENSREEITDLLTARKWGKDRFGTPDKILPLLDEIEDVFARGENLSVLEKLGRTQIEAHTRKDSQAPRHDFFDCCDEVATAMNNWFEALEIEAVAEIRVDLAERKRQRRLIGFGDMLENVDRTLVGMSSSEKARLRGKWRAVLIDEFQDTDPVQDRIFRLLFEPTEHWIYLIGDPKQAIYGFRGADLETYLRTAEICDRAYSLGTNHRSEKRLVEAVNQLFSVKTNPFEHEKITFRPVAAFDADPRPALEIDEKKPAPLILWTVDSGEKKSSGDMEQLLCEAVAAETKRLLDGAVIAGKRLRVNEIAVLTGTNDEASSVQIAFQRMGIPAVIQSGRNVFHSPEAGAVSCLFAAALDPRRGSLWRAALATPLFGLRAADIAALEDDAKSALWADRFQRWHVQWRKEGIARMFSEVLSVGHLRERLMTVRNGERSVTNFLHLAELLHGAELSEKRSPANLLRWLDERIEEKDGGEEAKNYEQRLETDSDAAQIMTIHRSKGLEFPVVFVPFAWKGLKPRAGNNPLIFHDDPEGLRSYIHRQDRELAENRVDQEESRENLRRLYVAVTRARQRCYLTSRVLLKRSTKGSSVAHLLGSCAELLKSPDIEVQPIGIEAVAGEGLATAGNGPNPELQRRIFSGWIRNDWRVASFTGLSHAAPSEEPERDEAIVLRAATETGGLPAGANTGRCLHEVLEKIDFRDETEWPEIVRKALRREMLDQAGAEETVLEMLRRTVRNSDAAWPSLNQIPLEDRIQELEFILPLGSLTPEKLHAACENSPAPIDWPHLNFSDVRGMLKGFIDLVFRYRGKFYLIDWKSNLLPDYTAETIVNAMRRAHYGLQYLLYTVALRRQLRERMPGFEWDRDFGGVRYIFLRGGVFEDKPSEATLEKLDQLFR